MTVVPQTSPVPASNPFIVAMSQSLPTPAPTPTPIPVPPHDTSDPETGAPNGQTDDSKNNSENDVFEQPTLRLEIRHLQHPGAAKFLASVNAGTVMATAVGNVQRLLYKSPSDSHTTVPPTRSVTLILRDMDGVAYTTGTELDNDHKEIHFSLNYINGISTPRLTDEITGVLTHELVHCYQWDARGTCPGGLIEGIADWVRLNCDLSPPHWKRETEGGWDRGYQHTAYFLDFLVQRFGHGTVRRINEQLREHKYECKEFWTGLLGCSVEQLWQDYIKKSEGERISPCK